LLTPLERDAPLCLYTSTAAPAPPTPTLDGDLQTQVLIVGAGYTGLSAALHLAERGIATVVLEAHEPGWGAAGRNGGQINAGLKHEPDEVERDLGPVHGPRLVRLAGAAAEQLFRLIARLRIDCEARREGTLRAAYRHADVATLEASVAQWQRRGVHLELLNRAGVAAVTGTARYLAATVDTRGGSVNPLGLARGLAVAAIAAGARICGNSLVERLERTASGWRAYTTHGRVHAERLVLATDGYSDELWPGLRRSVVPIYSAIVASAPLKPAVAATALPGGGVLYESGDITVYYRRDRENRLLMGGRGRQRPMAGHADVAHLTRYAAELWPALAGVDWTHRWNGQFALTPDFYPRLHQPYPDVFIALGYSGRGVALGVAVGAELAAVAAGGSIEALSLPVSDIAPIPFHAFWKVGVSARVLYGRLRSRFGA
jgi:glycine/D-amino acid oxidase-like deaminating enzyme